MFVKSFFALFSVQLESTWASKDDQAGFVATDGSFSSCPSSSISVAAHQVQL